MRKSLLLAGMLAIGLANAQTGKIGIKTETPTENLDVNGTVRVRQLPDENTVGIYTTGTDTSSATADQTFVPTKFVVADANGVLGVTTTQELGTVASDATEAAPDDSSTAILVKKVYYSGDYPGALPDEPFYYYDPNLHTGFSTAKWDAIITINRLRKSANVSNDYQALPGLYMVTPLLQGYVYYNGVPYREGSKEMHLDLDGTGTYWRVVGDVVNMSEEWEFTILFINKKYIASDPVRHIYKAKDF